MKNLKTVGEVMTLLGKHQMLQTDDVPADPPHHPETCLIPQFQRIHDQPRCLFTHLPKITTIIREIAPTIPTLTSFVRDISYIFRLV